MLFVLLSAALLGCGGEAAEPAAAAAPSTTAETDESSAPVTTSTPESEPESADGGSSDHPAATPSTAIEEATDGPIQNTTLWHSVYGVYSCDLPGDGSQKYLPPFQSFVDDTGLHSHGDGLIHIHPFFELSSGVNAQMNHWFNEMNIVATPDAILVENTYDLPARLVAGAECADGSGRSKIVVLRWSSYEDAMSGSTSPTVYESAFETIRFERDGELFVLAHIGESTEPSQIPLPPQERFDVAATVGDAIEWMPGRAGDGSLDDAVMVAARLTMPDGQVFAIDGWLPRGGVDTTIDAASSALGHADLLMRSRPIAVQVTPVSDAAEPTDVSAVAAAFVFPSSTSPPAIGAPCAYRGAELWCATVTLRATGGPARREFIQYLVGQAVGLENDVGAWKAYFDRFEPSHVAITIDGAPCVLLLGYDGSVDLMGGAKSAAAEGCEVTQG